MRRGALVLAVLVGVISGIPGAAESVSYRGWGPRVGLADDPDQLVFGAQFDLGQFADQVRFVPNVELGLGDDHTLLAFTAPVHFRWENLAGTDIVPFVGGGPTVALNHDDGPGDDTDFEIAIRAVGGAEWRLANQRTFQVELGLILGDVHDVQVMVGWLFRH